MNLTSPIRPGHLEPSQGWGRQLANDLADNDLTVSHFFEPHGHLHYVMNIRKDLIRPVLDTIYGMSGFRLDVPYPIPSRA